MHYEIMINGTSRSFPGPHKLLTEASTDDDADHDQGSEARSDARLDRETVEKSRRIVSGRRHFRFNRHGNSLGVIGLGRL